MRVRVCYTTTVDDDYRRAINIQYGRPGLATREQVKRWLEQYGSSQDDSLMQDLEQHERDVDDLIAELGAA